MKILFLSRWVPYPPNNGSKLRIYNLLRGLGEKHDVTLLTFQDQPDVAPDEDALLKVCRNVHLVPYKRFDPQSGAARLGFLSPKPRSVIDTFSQQMAQSIAREIATGSYDAVVASQIDMAVYHDYFQSIPALFEELEVGTLYENFAHANNWKTRLRAGLTWTKYRRYLATVLQQYRLCTAVSEQERQLLMAQIGTETPIAVVPNCIDLASYADVPRTPRPDTLIFTGSFTYEPNYEAMVWFVQHVLPRIQAERPQVQLFITGNHADRSLPPAENVTRTGFVDDVRTWIASSWVALAPIWTGGGTRLKILEAMALHAPVVATAKGAEGLNARHGEHLLLADDPEAFAQAVLCLLQDEVVRDRVAQGGHQLVRQHYDWAAVLPDFRAMVERVAADR